MSISFVYYFLMMLTMSGSELKEVNGRPISHWRDVQVYYFYDSRLPNAVGQKTEELVVDLIQRQYSHLLKDGHLVYYRIDLATPEGEAVGRKCDINMTGLVIGRKYKATNLTQMAYAFALHEPQAFQQHVAYTIEKFLPSKYKSKK